MNSELLLKEQWNEKREKRVFKKNITTLLYALISIFLIQISSMFETLTIKVLNFKEANSVAKKHA